MLHTITVGELIALLEAQDRDARVVVTADYGDYHHTAQALALHGSIEGASLIKSAYSASGYALVEDDDYDNDNGDEVLVLR